MGDCCLLQVSKLTLLMITWRQVDYEEDGSGSGGYAKEMSKEWHAAARAMLTKQCEEADVVITTALIPGEVSAGSLYRYALIVFNY